MLLEKKNSTYCCDCLYNLLLPNESSIQSTMILFDFVMNQRLKRTIDTFPLSREALHVSSKSATRFADICRTFFGSAPRTIFWITPRSVYKAQKGASACNSTILDIVVSATRTLASVSSPQSVGINSRNTASICLKKQKESKLIHQIQNIK